MAQASRSVTVTPPAPLAVDTAYSVALDGVRDGFGNAAGPISLSFRTRGVRIKLSGAGSATAEAASRAMARSIESPINRTPRA